MNIFHVWANSFLSLFKIFTNITKLGLPVAQEYFHPGLPRQFSKCLKILKNITKLESPEVPEYFHPGQPPPVQDHLPPPHSAPPGKKTYKLLFLGGYFNNLHGRNKHPYGKRLQKNLLIFML